MNGLFPSLAVDRRRAPRCTPLEQAASLWVESPEADLQFPESIKKAGGDFRSFDRKHEEGTMGEIAVAERLLETLAPIRYFGLDSGEANPLFECEGGELLRPTGCFPSQPDKVCATK